MEEPSSKSILVKIGLAILVIALLDLFYLNYWVIRNEKLEVKAPTGGDMLAETRAIIAEVSPSPSTGETVSVSPSPAPQMASSETKTVVEEKTVIQTAQKEIFIPLGSSSTKSGTFADLAGLEVTIDTTKYSAIESVVFEASLWTDGGNGRAWAKLKNISDSNPFIESQISSSSSTGEVKTSGNIPILSGAKKYGVQAKTDLTDYSAHVENARIKITLK